MVDFLSERLFYWNPRRSNCHWQMELGFLGILLPDSGNAVFKCASLIVQFSQLPVWLCSVSKHSHLKQKFPM